MWGVECLLLLEPDLTLSSELKAIRHGLNSELEFYFCMTTNQSVSVILGKLRESSCVTSCHIPSTASYTLYLVWVLEESFCEHLRNYWLLAQYYCL